MMCLNHIGREPLIPQLYRRIKTVLCADDFCFQIRQPSMDFFRTAPDNFTGNNLDPLTSCAFFHFRSEYNKTVSAMRQRWTKMLVLTRKILVKYEDVHMK